MQRFFNLMEAEQLLPEIDPVLREIIDLKAAYQKAELALQSSLQRITLMGGTMVDRDQVAMQKSGREAAITQLKESIDKVHSFGCLLKDVDIGLIDFPTHYRGQEVYLCWKLGESGISFWHGVSEGFRGRKRIDEEFLQNHKGELTN